MQLMRNKTWKSNRCKLGFDLSELSEAIKVASEGALATKTVATYRRYVKQGMHSWDADFMKFVEGVWEVC